MKEIARKLPQMITISFITVCLISKHFTMLHIETRKLHVLAKGVGTFVEPPHPPLSENDYNIWQYLLTHAVITSDVFLQFFLKSVSKKPLSISVQRMLKKILKSIIRHISKNGIFITTFKGKYLFWLSMWCFYYKNICTLREKRWWHFAYIPLPCNIICKGLVCYGNNT